MAYLGSTPEYQSFTSGTDYFNGDGISVAFTLSRPVASVNDIEVVISNVVQQPSTAYSVSGTTITFTSAPPAGTANVYARYMSTATQTITPSPGTVGTSQLSPSLTNVPFFGGSTIGAGNATGMKNRIINGGMVLDQRNGGASITINTAASIYTLDRWSAYGQAADGVFTVQQSSTAPSNFTNSLSVTVTTADASISSTQLYTLGQKVEGYNIADLGWGTANAKTVTLSFKVRSSVTGTFSGSLKNSDGSRSFPFTYTISVANTWSSASITVPGDTTGTWLTTNGIGLTLTLTLGSGSSRLGTANTWNAGNYDGATGTDALIATNGATFYVTGVQLEEGNAATSFDFVDYSRQLQMCQRYYYLLVSGNNKSFMNGCAFSASQVRGHLQLPVTMRTAPAINQTSGTNYYKFDASTGVFVNDFSTIYATDTGLLLYEEPVSATAGQGGTWFTANSLAYIAFSAEL
tara:strand:- start:148 stop:1536 length:1389 start_codon:yes stop_codon:yes gene_type:complete